MQVLMTRCAAWVLVTPHWPTNQLFSMNNMIWNTLLDSLGKLSVPLPAPFSLPASSLWGQHEKWSLWLSVSTVLQQLKHQHVISITLLITPKHNTTAITRREITSITTKTRTGLYELWCYYTKEYLLAIFCRSMFVNIYIHKCYIHYTSVIYKCYTEWQNI